MKTGLFSDPIFQEHDTGNHPENAGRLVALGRKLESDPLWKHLEHRKPRPATEAEIAAVHTVDYIRTVEEASHSGHPFLGTPDCVLSSRTYEVALHAAGALVDAAGEVAEGSLNNAFVACRPPGHHAEQAQAMGFCYFNNVAITAESLIDRFGYERVLIFDFDVHHGNGTQHSFQSRKDVFFASIHQHPATLYPGTGFAEERGMGEGTGYTLNAPMPPQSDDEAYRTVFDQILLPQFREFNPQFILISAGFDAHRNDPLAMIDLTQAGFDHLILGMKRLAEECCEGRMVSVLEGGYDYDALSDCVTSHVSLMQADSVNELAPTQPSDPA